MLSSTALAPMKFTPTAPKQKFRMPTKEIGWLHAQAAKPGGSFDITIRDALGRIKFDKKGCKFDTEQYGELVRIPTLVGEELDVEVRAQGTEEVSVFFN